MAATHDFVIMAVEHFGAVAVPVVHAVAEAVAPDFAVGAGALAGPAAVAECLEPVFPDVVEIVFVDTPLTEGVAVDIGAGADASVDEDRGDVDPRVAEVWDVADLSFISAQVTLTTERYFHRSFASCLRSFAALRMTVGTLRMTVGTLRMTRGPLGLDEVHQPDEFLVGEVHVGVGGGAADGDDGEDAPLPHTERGQATVEFF